MPYNCLLESCSPRKPLEKSMWVEADIKLSNGRLVLPSSGGQRERGRDQTSAAGSQGGTNCSPGGHKWVGRSGETQSTPWTPQNLGCHIKEARTGIIPNNRIFPIVCQGLSKVLFALPIFWSSQQPLGRKGTSTQRTQCPSSHN